MSKTTIVVTRICTRCKRAFNTSYNSKQPVCNWCLQKALERDKAVAQANQESTRRKEVRLYCKCGGAWVGNVSPKAAELVLVVFKEDHSGEGCAPCDSKTASRARMKAERKEVLKS